MCLNSGYVFYHINMFPVTQLKGQASAQAPPSSLGKLPGGLKPDLDYLVEA